ncbi:MAG: RHS repeat-associated core domain-containing protein [Armatimonadetes bacterium]|nr:RHS repeat-associated core domain-containing protein [Armatimonadota bacterium]
MGRLVEIQEEDGQPVTFSYSGACSRIETVTCPKPGTTDGSTVSFAFSYNHLGDITSIVGPGNNATSARQVRFEYTDPQHPQASAGQVLRVIDELGSVTSFDHDLRGNMVRMVDALGDVTSYGYDLRDRLTEMHLPLTGESETPARLEFGYRGSSGPLTSVKAYGPGDVYLGQRTYSYGPANELLAVAWNGQPLATYSYDPLYRLSLVTDAVGRQTRFEYGPQGWLTAIHHPGSVGPYGVERATAHDPVGRVLEWRDGGGQVTRWEYAHPAGLLTAIRYPASPADDVEFAYDGSGRLHEMRDSSGLQRWLYDSLGLVLTHTTAYAGLPPSNANYSCHPDGSRASLALAGVFRGYAYNAAGRLVELTSDAGNARWMYTASGLLERRVVPGGASTEYQYGPGARLSMLTNRHADSSVLSRFAALSYDSWGRLAGFSAELPDQPGLSGLTTFQYDELGRLRTEVSSRGGGYHLGSRFDLSGDATVFRSGNPDEAPQWRYSVSHQLLTSFTGQGPRQSVWRADGTPQIYQALDPLHAPEVQFDPEQRLRGGLGEAIFGYRGDGLRAWKEVAGERVWYLYDGLQLGAELSAAGTVLATHLWGADGLLGTADELYLFDPFGTVSVRLDDTGNIIDRPLFDAWGNQLAGDATTYGFDAQYGYRLDIETGLYLATWRYYDPIAGRFLTRDPIGFGGGLNLYAYVGNPVMITDPLGLVKYWKAHMAGGRTAREVEPVSFKKAVSIRKKQDNVIVRGSGAKREAERLEERAFPRGRHEHHTIEDHETGFSHWQTKRKHGHTFHADDFKGLGKSTPLDLPGSALGGLAPVPPTDGGLLWPEEEVKAAIPGWGGTALGLLTEQVVYQSPVMQAVRAVYEGARRAACLLERHGPIHDWRRRNQEALEMTDPDAPTSDY